jgi:fucose permease
MPTNRSTSRVLMLITFLAFVSIGFPDAVLGVAWPSMRETFERALPDLGFIVFSSGVGYFLSGMFAGRAIERLGVGRLLAFSTTFVALGLFGYALMPTFWPLLLAAFLIGLGSGAVDAGLNFYAAEHFSVTVMNWLHAFFGVGAMVGPFIMAGVFAAGGGWRVGYVIVASTIAAMAVVFMLTLGRWTDGDAHTSDAAASRVPVGTVMRIPAVWLQIAIFFVMCGIEASAGNWTATILAGKFDASQSTASLWAGIFWGSMAVGRIVMVPLVRDMNPARLVQLCTWGLVAGSLLMTFDAQWLYQVGLIVFGLAMAPLFPTMMSLTPLRFGTGISVHTIGFQVSAATVGIITITTTGGIIADRTSLTAIPVVMLIGSVLVVLMDMVLRRMTDDRPATESDATLPA